MNFGFRTLNPTTAIWDGADLLGDLNSSITPLSFVNGDPVNNVDIDGLYAATNGFTGKYAIEQDPGSGGGRVPGAPEEEKYQGKPKETIAIAEASYAALRSFILSDGPAYNDMSPMRQKINDFANTSFMRTAHEWNPYGQAADLFSGLQTGKGLYGNSMSKGNMAMAAIMIIPMAKLVKVAKVGIAESRILGKLGEEAVGLVGKKVAIKVAGRTRIPDSISKKFLKEVKNVSH